MQVIAAMFDRRQHAEDAIERLVAARCPRDAVTFLPEEELTDVATGGRYDWQTDKWGLWRGLATFEVMSNVDKYCFAEGMHRGGSTLLVAAKNEDEAERYGAILSEAGAVDLDELEQQWTHAGWTGYDGPPDRMTIEPKRLKRAPRVRMF